MPHIHMAIKRIILGLIVTVQVGAFPVLAVAQTTETATDPAASTTTTQTSEASESQAANTGPESPQGPDANTYTYNEETGLWENDHYTWNPETNQTAPKQSTNYSYNPETEAWDTTEYKYDAATGTYKENTVSTTAQPQTAATGGSTSQPASTATTGSGGGNQSVTQTGPNSDNSISDSTDRDITFDLFYNASISNNIDSIAITGDASVLFNTTGGSATSGDAKAIASLLNMLQSSWDPANGDLATFVADLNGGIVGDLLLDPSALINQTGPNSNNSIDNNQDTDLTITARTDGTITNDVNLQARSGNATVSNNTEAGDATSGDATAVANIFNMMNSMISSGTSFFGALNIHGDLDGDILLPTYIMKQLIAMTGPDSDNTITNQSDTNADVDVSNAYNVNNNVSLGAASGAATVSNNTEAGNATTGAADTSLKMLNLTGHNITSPSGLLVFVNVMGEWVGLILDVPQTNSLLLTGPNSSNTITNQANVDLNADISNTGTITNNINVAAQTGDATVNSNTTAGNATSGNAHAAANVVNLIDSQLDFSSWFGVLFINIFGDWIGSFGVNTEAGNPNNPVIGGKGGGQTEGVETTSTKRTFIDYRPATSGVGGSGGGAVDSTTSTTGTLVSATTESSQVLGSNTVADNSQSLPENLPNTGIAQIQSQPASWWPMVVSAIAGILLLGGERIIGLFRNRG